MPPSQKNSLALITTLLLGSNLLGFASIAHFDFQNAWTGAKEPNFTTFASNAASIDTDATSTASLLSNNGFTSGGFASFSLKDSAAGTSIFSSSASPDVGLNIGGANQTSATNYFSFTVTPGSGQSISYDSLSLYTSTNCLLYTSPSPRDRG